MKKVLFIAYYFPPIGGAGVQRSLKFARYLPEDGYLPVVLTGPGSLNDRWTPDDPTLFREIPPNLPIYRVNSPEPQSPIKMLRRIGKFLGFPSSFSKWWVGSAISVGEKACVNERPELIYVSMSPFESAKIAIHLSRKFGIPWIADLRDPWVLDEMRVYPSFIHRKVALLRMHRALSSAAVIIMNTPEATVSLKRSNRIFLVKRVVTITNGFDCKDFEETISCNSKKFQIVHSGYLHTDFGITLRRKRSFHKIFGGMLTNIDVLTRSHIYLMKAIEEWCRLYPDVSEHIEVVFIGAFTKRDYSVATRSNISNIVRFTGYLPHSESLRYIRGASLLFLPMHNLPENKKSTIIPGKTFEYMASGRPILAAVPDGDAKNFLAECGTAFLCRPDDGDKMVQILKKVYDSWRKGETLKKVNKNFMSRFERKHLTTLLGREFSELLRQK